MNERLFCLFKDCTIYFIIVERFLIKMFSSCLLLSLQLWKPLIANLRFMQNKSFILIINANLKDIKPIRYGDGGRVIFNSYPGNVKLCASLPQPLHLLLDYFDYLKSYCKKNQWEKSNQIIERISIFLDKLPKLRSVKYQDARYRMFGYTWQWFYFLF